MDASYYDSLREQIRTAADNFDVRAAMNFRAMKNGQDINDIPASFGIELINDGLKALIRYADGRIEFRKEMGTAVDSFNYHDPFSGVALFVIRREDGSFAAEFTIICSK